MIWRIGVGLYLAVTIVFVVSLCRAAASVEQADFDDDDAYCPRCDGTDLFGWGEDSWLACNGCKMLFKQGETT